MKAARVITQNFRGHHAGGGAESAEMVLKAGAKGRFRELHRVEFWPWSGVSEIKAEEILEEIAAHKGYEIVSWE